LTVECINYFLNDAEFLKSFFGVCGQLPDYASANKELLKSWLDLVATIISKHHKFFDMFKQHKIVPILMTVLTFEDDDDIRFLTCKVLKLYAEDPEGREQINQADGVRLLLNLLRSSNRVVQLQAARVLSRVLEDLNSQTIFLDNDGLNIASNLILSPNADLQLCIFDLFIHFIGNERVTEKFDQLKLRKKYMKMLEYEIPELRLIAIKAIGKYASCELISDDVEMTSLMTTLMNVMNVSTTNVDIELLVATANALSHFTKRRDYCAMLCDMGLPGKIVNLMSTADVRLGKALFALLCNLVNDPKIQEACTVLGCCEMCLKFISHESPEIRHFAITALDKLTAGNVQGMKRVSSVGGIFQILAVFCSTKDENEKLGLSKILLGFSIERETQNELCDNGAVSVIVDTLQTAQNDELLQTLVFILSVLSENKTNRDIILEENGITVILKILTSHKNLDLLTAIVDTLLNFANDVDLLEPLRLNAIVDVLHHILVNFTNEKLLVSTLRALLSISQTESAKLAIQNKIGTILKSLAAHNSLAVRTAAQKVLSLL